MNDEQDQIASDIYRWADKKLKQWFMDSMMRYEVADIPPSDASADLVSLMFKVTATLLASTSYMDPHEAGNYFAKMVDDARRKTKAMDRAKAVKRERND